MRIIDGPSTRFRDLSERFAASEFPPQLENRPFAIQQPP